MPARTLPWLAGLLVLGAGVRAVYLVTPDLDSDMAIVGLMGRHILAGEFPIFFWGQAFAGTAESHLAALLFFLFGASRLTLALAPFLFSLAFLVLTYRVAREAYDREVGLVALLLTALPAPFLVTHSVTARANYIYSVIPVMTAAFLVRLRRATPPIFAVALAGLLLAHVAGAVATTEVFDPRKLERYRRERARDRELIELLAADRLTRVYVLDFWDAYRLTFDAGERFVFAEPGRSFYPPYTALVDAAARYGYVVRGHGRGFERQLAAVGGSYRKREVAGYAVFDALVPPPAPPLQPLPRDGWHATASQAPDDAGRALDREPATSWQSSPAAGGGERYELDLGAVRRVGQVAFLFGPTSPPGVRIEVSVDKMHWEPALAAPWSWLFWTDSRLTADRGGRATFRFAPRPARWLRIAPFWQTEPAAWSLGEVFVAEASEAAGASRPGAEALRGGQARAGQGDWPGAIRAFQEAVERDPDWEAPYFRLLAAYERLGLERLGEPYERALGLDARGLPAVAAWEYARAARQYPHSHHSYPLLRLLAQYEAERDPARAEEVRRRLAAFTPAREVAASFGGRLRLLGYTVDREGPSRPARSA